MINLLPPEVKSGYHYARRNVVRRRWVIAFLVALAGLGVLGTYGLLALHESTMSYNNQISDAQAQLQKNHLNQTKKQVEDMSNSLKLAVQVLSNEVLFSKVIQQIGAVMPNGTVLTGLTIGQVQGGLELTAESTNYIAGTQIQVNLTDPANEIFSKVDIESIKCGGDIATGSVMGIYQCKVQLRALFDSNNAFLFINQGKKS